MRADSSSEWENPDAGKYTNVSIPPVGGGFRTFGGRCAGVFLQWVEVFGLWESWQRADSSSEWAIWDAERCVGG